MRTVCFLQRLCHKVKGALPVIPKNVSLRVFPIMLAHFTSTCSMFLFSGATKFCCQRLVSVSNPYSTLTSHVVLKFVRNSLIGKSGLTVLFNE